MIPTLRALYLSRPLREKILVAALAAILVLWWLSNFVGRAQERWASARSTTLDLQDQAQWLARSDVIIDSANKAAARLDASRTLDGTRLLATVDALAGDAGLRNTTSGEITHVSSGQFAIYRLSFNVVGADWPSLKEFYLGLQKHSPYIGIDQLSLQANRANPALLNVVVRLSSVEIASH